ncbi:unnamed protein product [Ceratitis capitata]|uniref:(Mediterranean fruit fly) hypothetical protein n=1 Tax=Ceratitis capitata TaxID=7213 RepID=A0A811VGQ3_CERCA|nr:unnamed protein product [Ceratitis capitata]
MRPRSVIQSFFLLCKEFNRNHKKPELYYLFNHWYVCFYMKTTDNKQNCKRLSSNRQKPRKSKIIKRQTGEYQQNICKAGAISMLTAERFYNLSTPASSI